MDCNTEIIDPWEWQSSCKILDDYFDPECLWSDDKVQEDASFICDNPVTPSFICDNPVTPAKRCEEFSSFFDDAEEIKKMDKFEEPSARFKRRRIQYDPKGLDGVRSQNAANPVEQLPKLSDWNLQCPEGPLVAGCGNLDQSSEAWHSSLIDDVDDVAIYSNEKSADDVPIYSNEKSADGVLICSDEKISPHQIKTTGNIKRRAAPSSSAQKCAVRTSKNPLTGYISAPSSSAQKCAVRTSKNPLTGKKPLTKSSAGTKSLITYPFSFLKPSAAAGDVTLNDINRRINCPPPALKQKYPVDDLASYPTSAFSGKPVVGATTIRTEGGKGAITILRTKG